MNIRLVSVTERTREIGIRMSIGARGSDILAQFLTEAVVLSMIGGLVGVALGVGIIFAIPKLSGLAAVVPMSAIALSVGFAALVGIAFGVYPARKAAQLDPIQALRYQ
jgi:putative ABC transport system permease protein